MRHRRGGSVEHRPNCPERAHRRLTLFRCFGYLAHTRFRSVPTRTASVVRSFNGGPRKPGSRTALPGPSLGSRADSVPRHRAAPGDARNGLANLGFASGGRCRCAVSGLGSRAIRGSEASNPRHLAQVIDAVRSSLFGRLRPAGPGPGRPKVRGPWPTSKTQT